jgi:hypothetical protein
LFLSFTPPAAVVFVSGCTLGEQPGDVEGHGGQSEFVSDLIQSTGAKLAYSTLLFEDSEDRFDDCLAPRMGSLSGRRSQFSSHLAAQPRTRIAQRLLCVHAIFTGVGRHPRRIDRHPAQLDHALRPRSLQHLRKGVVQRAAM